jgi:hypothetical protein
VGPRASLQDAENLVPTGIRSPDRPARNESLYRLSYPDLITSLIIRKNMEHLWHDSDRVKPKYYENHQSKCQFVRHKSHTVCHEIEPGPQR